MIVWKSTRISQVLNKSRNVFTKTCYGTCTFIQEKIQWSNVTYQNLKNIFLLYEESLVCISLDCSLNLLWQALQKQHYLITQNIITVIHGPDPSSRDLTYFEFLIFHLACNYCILLVMFAQNLWVFSKVIHAVAWIQWSSSFHTKLLDTVKTSLYDLGGWKIRGTGCNFPFCNSFAAYKLPVTIKARRTFSRLTQSVVVLTPQIFG